VRVPLGEPGPDARGVKIRALAANSGFVLLCVAVGGLSAELLQIWGLQVLHFSPGQLGVTFGAMVISVPLQLRAIAWVNRVGQQRAMRVGYLGIAVGLVAFQLVALLGRNGRQDASFALFLVSVVFIEVCVSCSWGTAWFSWIGEFTTRDDRQDFLRRMRLSTQLVYAAGVLSFSALLGNDPKPWHFHGLYLVLLVYVLAAYQTFATLPSGGQTGEEVPHGLRRVVADHQLRYALVVVFVQAFIAVPLVVSWLLIRDYPAYVIGVGSTVQSAVTIATLFLLRPALASWPPFRTLRVFGLAGAAASVLWLSLPAYDGAPSTVHYLALLFLSSVAASGTGVGWQGVLFELIPADRATAGFALTDLITSSTAQLYSLGVGVALGALAGSVLVGVPGTTMFKLFFVISALASIAVVALSARRPVLAADG
jgi:hypothetical protein